jgi:hypothetical protein
MSLNRLSFFASVLLLAWAAVVWGNNIGGPPSNRSGVNGITCSTSGCHNLLDVNAGSGSVTIGGLPSEWSASTTYPLTVTVSQSGQSLFGFQMTSVDSTGTQVGTFTSGSGTQLEFTPPGGIEHSFAKAGSGSGTFSFDWTSPSSLSTGNVRFNVAGNAANGDSTSGSDFIYSAETTVSAATVITQNEIFYFPHIADGGSFKTTLFITNPGATSTTANVTITFDDFADSDGNTIVPSFIDNQGQQFTGSISFQLAGGKSRQLVSTAASSSIGVGFATVASDIPVTGSAIFSQFSGSNLIAEAGVPPSPTSTSQAMFVDEAGFFTAFAYANPSTTETANITFNLLNAEGQSVGTQMATLAPLNHSSLFIRDLFSNTTDHIGTMQITSDVAVTVVSLRFKNDFSIFTSVPPFTLTQ